MYTVLEAQQILLNLFGLDSSCNRLSGEYDYNFHIKADDTNEFLLKISHPNEKISIIEMQNDVLHWLQASPKTFNFPIPQRTLANEWVGELTTSKKNTHYVRLFTFISGNLFAQIKYHSPELLENLGVQLGHLSQSLTNFHHPAAKRFSRWDLKQALWIRDQLNVIKNIEEQQCVRYFLERFESDVAPVLSNCRQSIIHGDLNDYNILVSSSTFGKDTVTGFIDFGDVVETATICELAIAATYAILDKPDPLAAAAQIIKGYHTIFPLQEVEIDILFDLICIRLCISVVNSAIRKKESPNETYLTISEKPAWSLLKKLKKIHSQLATCIFRDACTFPDKKWQKSKILKTRQQRISKNITLSYNTPLQIVQGIGQYLIDENGRQYLDCINNVAHVGHCHPKVVEAGQRQMAILNTNTRYLDENLARYAERLIATLPLPLEVCFFVCSGSEANELAIRLAQAHTGRSNFLVMDHSYHGNTSTLINMSPYKFNGTGGKGKPDFVQVLPIPDAHQVFHIPTLNKNLAAFICESILSCGGQVVLPNDYLKYIYSAVRNAGGVCIADEIQVGLGRAGTHFWGFETQQVVPDIVTMGKPLGNGHPIAAVVTTREIAESFNNGMEYFNTFGGNPVSCAIGLSVLNVLQEENLQIHALQSGNHLKQQLNVLKNKHSFIKDVRGLGLFLGIELMTDISSNISAKDFATHVINQMKDRGVLLSADGPLQNVIKIKPPLIFTKENGDVLSNYLDDILSSFCSPR